MEHLINATEVIEIAIPNKNLREEWVKDAAIEIAQEHSLRPVLGNDFFDRLMTTPRGSLGENEINLIDIYIKPILAYAVKYQIIPDVYTQLTNTGVMGNNSEYANRVSKDDKNTLRSQAKSDSEAFIVIMTRYLNDNETLFPLYSTCENKKNTFTTKGGFIFRRPQKKNNLNTYFS